VKQKSNKILTMKKQTQNKLWQENAPKIGVEQIKGNREFYLYLYPLAT